MLLLKSNWQILESDLIKYQKSPDEVLKKEIIKNSETCWAMAVEVVLIAQHIAEEDVRYIKNLFYLFLVLNITSAGFVLFLVFSYVRKKLEYESSHDALSALYNRRTYEDVIESEVSRSQRYGSTLSLILFDIDRFKSINDNYGHSVGDKIIIALANLISDSIRQSDTFFRVGGEEFAVVCPNTDLHSAMKLAEIIRKRVEGHSFGDVEKLTISLGVAECNKQLTKDLLYQHADQAMYSAKNNGRNRSEVFSVGMELKGG